MSPIKYTNRLAVIKEFSVGGATLSSEWHDITIEEPVAEVVIRNSTNESIDYRIYCTPIGNNQLYVEVFDNVSLIAGSLACEPLPRPFTIDDNNELSRKTIIRLRYNELIPTKGEVEIMVVCYGKKSKKEK